MDMRLEVIMVPVSDVDRAKSFYLKLGFREDIDLVKDDYRVVQLTPPGSTASIFIGNGITPTKPGSLQGLVLVVDDVVAAHDDLVSKGVEVGQAFHDPNGLFYHVNKTVQEPGPDPEHISYRSFSAFSDPDGNGWIIQEITKRLPGR
jgi:catechol 2,3-dioxygenase-like lactoylglutathione lyase family enzyme